MKRMISAFALCLAMITCTGCAWLMGGQDEEVVKARAESEEAMKKAEEARSNLALIEARHKAGLATDEELSVAKAKADTSLVELDASIAEYNAALAEAAQKHADLGKWGAKIGGLLGPVGEAIGGLLPVEPTR